MATFTLTGTLEIHSGVPRPDVHLEILGFTYPDAGIKVVYLGETSVVTDANGSFTTPLTVLTGSYYVVRAKNRKHPLRDPITNAAFEVIVPSQTSGSTHDISEFMSTAAGTVTPSVLSDALAARDAALAAQTAASTSATAAAASAASVNREASNGVAGLDANGLPIRALPRWRANTAVTAGDVWLVPDGSVVSRNTTGTTRASFDATEQGFWTAVLMKSGTLEQVAFDARTRAQYAPSPSGDTTGATDTANIVAALAAMSKTAGGNTPTTDPMSMELGAGPYYINPGSITIGAGQAVRSKARMGTLINCVGGTVGQAFLLTADTSFTLTGGIMSSRGGEVSGLILDGSKAGRGTIAVTRGNLLNSKLDVSIRNFGANVIPTASATSTTVNGRGDTTVVTSGISIVTDTSVAIADLGAAVSGTGIPAGTVVASLVKGVKFNVGTQAPAPANATGSGSITLQVGWFRNDTVTLTSGSNFIPDASAVAGDLNAPVFGTNIPVDAIVMAVDPGVGLYLGVPARGVLFQNQGSGWYERNDDRIETFNCALSVVFDGAVTNNSYSYNKMYLTTSLRHDQKLLHVRGAPALLGQDWTVYGTFASAGANNNGVGLMQSGASNWRGRMEWHVESAVSGTQGHVPHFMADSASTFFGYGSFEFYAGSGQTAWQVAKRQIGTLSASGASAIGFKGLVGGVWNIIDNNGFGMGSGRTVGVETKNAGLVGGTSPTVTFFLETSNVFKVGPLTSGAAYTVTFNSTSFMGTGVALEVLLIFVQSAGTAATIATWPTGITWKGGTAAQLDPTLSSQTAVRLVTTDGGATWYGSAV